MQETTADPYREFRRDLHEHPEPAWCEFYTTSRIVEALREREVDAIHVGREAHATDLRKNVPDDDTLAEWHERASEAGADPDVLAATEGGYTGCVAVVERGDGPVIGLRVDIDALPVTESEEDDHNPAAEGFRSGNEGYMHACGHDAHATIGLGVLDAVLDSEFDGTLKVFFQPSEEVGGGGEPMAKSGHFDDVDYLFAVHIGLDHPSGEIVAGVTRFLATRGIRADFAGQSSHAGGRPEQGRNTVQAMATAVQNLYAIPRHGDGPTRINAGVVGGGTATNVIPDESFVHAEARGGTDELADYMEENAIRVIRNAAEMHGCEVDIETTAGLPGGQSDEELIDVVADVAPGVEGVDTVVDSADLGGSEDATHMMQYVQDRGGFATYVGVGTDHPGGHHTPTFDVNEDDLRVGIGVLVDAILRASVERP